MSTPAPADILLVDDRPENLVALQAILEPLGQRLERATSGEEALRRILAKDFALIVLDVQMPGMNGFEVARLIKSRERSKHIPIIFLTAISKDERYVFEGYSVGAVDYIAKPFDPDILRSKVAVFVDLHQKGVELQRQAERLRAAERRELELRHRADLAASETRLSWIVEAAMDAIIGMDAELTITAFNGAAEEMFGRTAREAIGMPVGELFAPACRDDVLQRIRATPPRGGWLHAATRGMNGRDAARWAANGASGGAPGGMAIAPTAPAAVGAPTTYECTGVRADGTTFPLEASLSTLLLLGARSHAVIARDITERKRQEAMLREQAESLERALADLRTANEELHRRQEELERAMGARNRFYASMSHELRTPINAILGYTTLLLDNIYGALNERQEHSLGRVHKAATHLLELVNDVLDLSKIEAGKIELQVQPVPFPALVEDLFVTVRPMAEERGSEISHRHEGQGRTIVTDPRRVRQILLNLLSNAIKFGNGQPIVVVTRALEDGGIEVDVVDRGVGIAAENVPRIFDEFVQIDKPEGDPGTGLGLPISQRLALLLNGSLGVESTPGEGSTFRLRLPPALSPDEPASGEQSTVPHAAATG
ncbi:MAG TPA: response regulator [Gemmatimonadaceae bacterium]|nr:response regulator [Gemmatimonadaceae bacterium]